MRAMPIQLRARLRHDARFLPGQHLAGGSAVLKAHIAARLDRSGSGGIVGQIDRKARHIVQHSKQNGIGGVRRQVVYRKPSERGLRRAVEQHIEVVERQEFALRIFGARADPLFAAALALSAVQRIACEYVRLSQRLSPELLVARFVGADIRIVGAGLDAV